MWYKRNKKNQKTLGTCPYWIITFDLVPTSHHSHTVTGYFPVTTHPCVFYSLHFPWVDQWNIARHVELHVGQAQKHKTTSSLKQVWRSGLVRLGLIYIMSYRQLFMASAFPQLLDEEVKVLTLVKREACARSINHTSEWAKRVRSSRCGHSGLTFSFFFQQGRKPDGLFTRVKINTG